MNALLKANLFAKLIINKYKEKVIKINNISLEFAKLKLYINTNKLIIIYYKVI